MPNYLVTLIWQHGPKHGSTETFYRTADNGRAASDFGGPDGLSAFMAFRPTSTVLQAIRAQEETGLKRIFLRLCWQHGNKKQPAPDNPGLAAKIQIPFAGGHRALELRGLLDSHVARTLSGEDAPAPGFLRAVAELSNRVRELRLCARSLQRHEKHQVLWYGRDPDSELLTLVQLREKDFAPAVGSYVDFGGGGLRWIYRSRGYLIMKSEPGYLSIYHPWGDVRDLSTGQERLQGAGDVWTRQLVYDYPPLGKFEFTGFGTFPTGREYHPVSWAVENPWRSPLSPCGRIEDFSRTFYSVDMGHWRDDPGQTVRVRWYRPEIFPGAALGQPRTIEEIPAVPYENPFGSRTWERPGDFLPALGERFEYTRTSGRPIALLRGIGLCGSRDAWENGASNTEPLRPLNEFTGQPCCCGPGALLPTGGAAGGGLHESRLLRGGAAGGGLVELPVMVEGGAGGGGLVEVHQLAAGGSAAGGLVEVLGEVRGGSAAGGYLPVELPSEPGPCEFVFNARYAKWKVTITGATGTKAALNGVWLLPWSYGGCAWYQSFPTVEFIELDIGDATSVYVFIALPGQTVRSYSNEAIPNLFATITLNRDTAIAGWPLTILVELIPAGKVFERGSGAGGGLVEVLGDLEGGSAAGGLVEVLGELVGGAAGGGLVEAEGGIPPDVIAPTVTSSAIDATGLVWTVALSEVVTGHSGYSLAATRGAVTATYSAGEGTATFTFALSRPIITTETVTSSYTAGDVIDGAANALANFSGVSVTNGSTVPVPNSLLIGLVSYWKLAETSGNAVDSHGTNTLTETSGTIDAAAGKITGARDFEAGDTEYFERADNADLSTGNIDFTFSLWAKPESTSLGQRTLISKGQGTTTSLEYIIIQTATLLRVRARRADATGTDFVDCSTTVTNGTWYFLLVEHDAGANQLRVAINNGAADVGTMSASGVLDSTQPFRIGAESNGANNYDGLICEVGFWKRLLTSTEKALVYGGGVGLPYSGFHSG